MPHLKSPHADHRNRRRYRSAHNTIEGWRHIAKRRTGRVCFLPFPPDMHASMMPKTFSAGCAFSNASLSTLRSPDLPQKRPLSLVSIVLGLLRLSLTCSPAGLPLQPFSLQACSRCVLTLWLRKLHKPLPRRLQVSSLAPGKTNTRAGFKLDHALPSHQHA